MGPDRRGLLLALIALIVSSTVLGCGDSGGATSTDSSAFTETQASTSASNTTAAGKQKPNPSSAQSDQPTPGPPASAFQPTHHEDSGGGSTQLIVKRRRQQRAGIRRRVRRARIPKAAATALHDFLDARAERNWAAACPT